MKPITEKSERYGYIDTLNNQREIRKKLYELIKYNKPLQFKEREIFIAMISKAFYGVGVNVTVLFPSKYGKIPLGKLHYFAQKMAYINSDQVQITYSKKTFKVNIKELWEIFLEYTFRVFPHAQSQALKMSGEKSKKIYGEPHELKKF